MIQLNLQELAVWSSGMILALTLQERISERIVAIIGVVSVPQIPEQIVKSCFYSQERIQQCTGDRLSTFPYRRWWAAGGLHRNRQSSRNFLYLRRG